MNLAKRFWPIILIFTVWFIFSSPYFLQQKVPFSSTYQVNFFSPWNAYPGFSSPVKNNAMPDVISQIYPWKTFTIDTYKNLQIPLWNPYSFSGTPHLANYQSAVLSPFNILFLLLPFIDAWSLLVLLQPLLAGLFMYAFLRSLKITKEGSVIGAIAFMFCGFITTWMAYGTLGYAILFLPLALFAIEKYYQTGKSKFLILLSFTFPLSFFSGHFQVSLYFFLFIILYLFYKLITEKDKKSSLQLFLYPVFGVLLSLPQLFPSIELYAQTLRSSIFQKIEVIPWGYLPTFIAPDFFGNPVTRNDWFGHYAEWNAYIGVFPLMLSFYAIFVQRTKAVLFFAFISLMTLLLSFQTPILDILVSLKIPVLSTSAASRIIVIFSFCMSVLAGFGLDSLMEHVKSKKTKPVLYWFLSFFLVFTSVWVIILLKLFIPVDKILISKQNFILPTILFAFSFLTIFLFFFSLRIKQTKKYIYLLPLILIVIISFDLLRFANKWMPFESKNLMYPQIPIAKEFAKISGVNRVFGNLGGEATTYYKLPSVQGYDAVYIKRYGEFIASLENGKLQQSARSVVLFPKYGLYTKQALNFLGIKYIIYKVADGHSPWTFPSWEYKDGIFSLLYNDGNYQVLENKEVFPRAFLVSKYIVENNSQKILNKMFAKNFDLRTTVILENDPKLKLNSSGGTTKIVSYAPNKIIINTTSDGNSLLFLSDTYYPGWEAFIDGKKSQIYRTDYTFRSVFVPKGNHIIEFIYNPLSFWLGVIFAVLGLILIGVFEYIRKRVI